MCGDSWQSELIGHGYWGKDGIAARVPLSDPTSPQPHCSIVPPGVIKANSGCCPTAPSSATRPPLMPGRVAYEKSGR
jgi:hypothetical protein